LSADQSIVIAAPTAVGATPLTAVQIAALFTDSATAINHVYVAVNATNIGTIWQVADAAGTAAGNIVATSAGTIDLADTAWSTLTAANFSGYTGALPTGTTTVTPTVPVVPAPVAPVVPPVVPPAGFTAVTLAVGLTAAGAVTTVAAAPVAESFSLNVGAARLSGPNTQDAITGFDVANDVLSFSGTGLIPGTTYTLASVLAGITTNVDGINNQTLVTFGPDAANADVVSLTLVGVATAADLVHVTIVS
jgi:hypothetical protein